MDLDNELELRLQAKHARLDFVPAGYLFFFDALIELGEPPPYSKTRKRLHAGELRAHFLKNGKLSPVRRERWGEPNFWRITLMNGHPTFGEAIVIDEVAVTGKPTTPYPTMPADTAHKNAVASTLTPDDRARGGSRRSRDAGLQEAVKQIHYILQAEGKKTTLGTIRQWLEENAWPSNPYNFDNLPDCEEIYYEGGEINWTDKKGSKKNLADWSLERYIAHAKAPPTL